MVCDKKVIFCSTVFKNENFLHKSFDNIKILSQLFSKVKILICYDYSGDKSLLELSQLKKEGFDIDIIINKKPRFIDNIGRAYNIGQARNQILDHIYNEGYDNNSKDDLSSYDYFIMCDLDDVFNFKVNPEILDKYLHRSNEWDSLSFHNEGFYDSWSVSIDHLQHSSWMPTDKEYYPTWAKQFNIKNYLQKIVSQMETDIRPIDSYFNGFCIHKIDKFKDIRYYPATMVDEELIIDCEHRSFYKGANKKGLKVMFSKDCLFDEMININLLNEK